MISFQVKMEKGKAEAKRAAVNPGYPVTKDILKLLGQSIKRRMFRGRFVSVATSWRGYNTKRPKSGYLTHPKYPVKSGKRWPSGVSIWQSSSDFHKSTRRGSFNVSGGMWEGLSILSNGKNKASMRFRGSSQGYSVKWNERKGKAIRKTINGKKVTVGRRESTNVISKRQTNNALKAWSIFNKTGVRVIDYSLDEFSALEEYWEIWLEKCLDFAFNGGISWKGGHAKPKSLLAKAMLKEASSGSTPFRQSE